MKQPETTLRGSENAQMERIGFLILQAKEAVQTAQRHLRAAVDGTFIDGGGNEIKQNGFGRVPKNYP